MDINDERFNDILSVVILDPDKFVKYKNCKPITNPIYFSRPNTPSDDGLLSNAIFGYTQKERSTTYAYIDLGGYYINPLIYKKWSAMDKRIDDIMFGTKKFIIDSSGELIEDEKGQTGVDFLRKNIDKIKINRTKSRKRDINIEFIEKNKDKIFMTKMIVLPAHYRDVNTANASLGVGEINKLYNNLILTTRSVKETQEYGLSLEATIKGRIQTLIVAIYNWFTSGAGLDGIKKESVGLSKKGGIIRRAVMSKTTDYGARTIISAPETNAETIDDMEATLDYCVLPMSTAAVNFFPYLLFHLKRFFENEFSAGKYPSIDKQGNIVYHELKDVQIEFGEDKLKKEIDRFIKGYSNRFIPIKIPTVDPKINLYMKFKGKNVSLDKVNDVGNVPISERKLTWCDVIYIALEEIIKDKHEVITRYPIDTYFNIFPSKIRLSSTIETVPMLINNTLYKKYPKISEEDIGKDTSNKFKDTLNINNMHLKKILGDYDGDMTSDRAIYLTEANDEIDKFIKSKSFLLDASGINVKVSSNETIQVLYQLTKVLDPSLLTEPF